MLLNTFRRNSCALLIAVAAVLICTAVVFSGRAAGDPSQDEQFLGQLNSASIPPLENASSLIATAHRVCGKIDSGMNAEDVVDAMRNKAFEENPVQRLYPADRVRSTLTRFVTAAVQTYCPYNRPKVNF